MGSAEILLRVKKEMSTFQSTQQLLDFAEKFFDDRRGPFCADVAVCLTPDDSDHRAEFPALITCIAFVELWSGLHVGNLGGDGLRKLQSYAAQFMNLDSLRSAASENPVFGISS